MFEFKMSKLVGLCAVIVAALTSTATKAAIIDQTVTLLDPQFTGLGPGSTSFDQFDPALGTLNAVTFKIPTLALAGSFSQIGMGFSTPDGGGFVQYQLGNPNFSETLLLQSFSGEGAIGLSSPLLVTSDPDISQYIGTHELSLFEDFTHTPGSFVRLSRVDIDSQGHGLLPSHSPEIIIGYDYTPSAIGAVPEPSTWAMMILGFTGVGFIVYRRRNWPATVETA